MRKIALLCIFPCLYFALIFEDYMPGALLQGQMFYDAVSRLFYAGAAVALCGFLRISFPCYYPLHGWDKYSISCVVVAFLLALSNLAWHPLLTGEATIRHPDLVPLLVLSCLGTAIFEELLFRVVFFCVMLRVTYTDRFGRFLAVVLTSLVYAIAHLFNLFAGAGLGETLLQLGYTFLIGCVAAVLMYLFRDPTLSILFHALFNFCGYLLPTLGLGVGYNMHTIIGMILASLAALIVFPIALWHAA